MGVLNNKNKVISSTAKIPKLKPLQYLNICFKCYHIPSVKILFDQPYKIQINCPSCLNEEIMSLKDYLNLLLKINQEKEEKSKNTVQSKTQSKGFFPKYASMLCVNYDDNQTQEDEDIHSLSQMEQFCIHHKDKENDYFCIDCKEHFCILCLSNHQSHLYCKLSNYVNESIIEKLILELGRAKNHIKEYNEKLKDIVVKQLKEQIERIEIAYTLNNRINTNIIDLIEILLNDASYNYQNFYSYNNLISHSKFNFNKPVKLNEENILLHINQIINYYNNNFIISESFEKPPVNELNQEKIDLSKLTLVQRVKEHKHHITCIILLKDGRVASSSQDNTIKVFTMNKNTLSCMMSIDNNKNYVNYLCELDDLCLVSCSADMKIFFYRLSKDDYEILGEIDAHSNNIWKIVKMSDNRIASCSFDHTIKIWNTKTYKLISTLEGHKKPVYSILYLKNNKLVSGTFEEQSLRFWNVTNYKCEREINKVQCFTNNSMIELNANTIAVGGYNNICIVNSNSYQIECRIINSKLNYIESFLLLKDSNLLCGTQEGSIILLDTKKRAIEYERDEVHRGAVNAMINIGRRYIITGSKDTWINIWKY